ncbi:MAG: 1-acyl-sn-glycerol-3-phosphate acyltransferase [Deltaproteobacteria bacterium]|nr:1-acyl-sn-glycerol-3-phosphate acyltransferase [Deltaproteobacteria bacterium]
MNSGIWPGLYRLCRFAARQTFQRLYRLQVEGLEFMPSEGPVILCPKHQRWEDIPVVGLAWPRPLYYIAKAELFRYPVVRELLRALGGVPVNRGSPWTTLSSFRLLVPLLKQRAHIVVFPEGTYVRGQVGPGKPGLLQWLLKWQAAQGLKSLSFVPMGISYVPQCPGYQVTVRLGPPIIASAAEQTASLVRTLMAQIARLSGTEAALCPDTPAGQLFPRKSTGFLQIY